MFRSLGSFFGYYILISFLMILLIPASMMALFRSFLLLLRLHFLEDIIKEFFEGVGEGVNPKDISVAVTEAIYWWVIITWIAVLVSFLTYLSTY